MQKRASSQAAWALLTEGVTQARVETHRAQHLLNRAQRLIDASEEKDHIYQVAGDIILALPRDWNAWPLSSIAQVLHCPGWAKNSLKPVCPFLTKLW